MSSPVDANECQPLIEACTLELYQKNIFRITSLPVDATSKEVARQVQKLQMMEEMSGGESISSAAFPLAPPPTNDQVRQALARMKEPEHRLVDEFFWYWPERFGESKNDLAIQAVLAGDGQKAVDLWVERENEGSIVAKHNLAIMFHMFAVDWTNHHVVYDIDTGRDEKIEGYWSDAFMRWEKLADSDDLWECLKDRVRSLEDEALTTGFVRRMRRVLPQGLDRVNAEAALKFAEQGQMDWAKFHVDFMRETNQGHDDVESTAELVLEPTKKRVEQRLQAARNDVEKRPEKGTQVAADLMAHCEPLMSLFDLFHGAESHQRNDLFDAVAETVVSSLVAYQKATSDNQAFVELLKKAMTFATGSHIRERLIKNIAIGENNLAGQQLGPFFQSLQQIMDSSQRPSVKLQQVRSQILPQLPTLAGNLGAASQAYRELLDSVALAIRSISIDAHNDHQDFQTAEAAIQLALKLAVDPENKRRIQGDIVALSANKKSSLCFFCGEQPAVKEATFQLAMFGDVQRYYRRVEYRTGSVPIPRCNACRAKHSKVETTGCVLWLVTIVVGALIGLVQGKDDWIAGAILGALAGWIVSKVAQSLMTSSSVLKSPASHPEVKKMLSTGWRIGEKPG